MIYSIKEKIFSHLYSNKEFTAYEGLLTVAGGRCLWFIINRKVQLFFINALYKERFSRGLWQFHYIILDESI